MRPCRARTPIEVDIDLLSPNEQQPRVQMDDAKLEELAESIRANGIIQPIVVRRVGDQLSHHRRRASLARGAAGRPAEGAGRRPRRAEDGANDNCSSWRSIENIQRENLNPIDEALAYQRLADELGLTQEQIAAAVGKDRSSVANFVRLLKLPEEVRDDLASGALSMGHARALLGLPDAAAQRQAVARSHFARPVGAGHGSAGQEMVAGPKPTRRRPKRRPSDAPPGRPYPGRRGPPPFRPWHQSPHRPARGRRDHRNRFRVGGRAESPLRTADRRSDWPGSAPFPWYKRLLVPLRYKLGMVRSPQRFRCADVPRTVFQNAPNHSDVRAHCERFDRFTR